VTVRTTDVASGSSEWPVVTPMDVDYGAGDPLTVLRLWS
jgi:hypothetical protein